MTKFWKNYNLSIVLAVLFVVSLAMQTWTGWARYVSEERSHGQTPTVFGSDGYVWEWGEATFENWQSEFLQLLSFVVLTSFLIHKGSHESKDGEEELKAMIRDVQKRLDAMESDANRTQPRRKAS